MTTSPMSSARLTRIVFAAAALSIAGSACAPRSGPPQVSSGLRAGDTLDVLIADGTVYDGITPTARRVDVGLRGDRVVLLGAVPRGVVVKRRLDASGLIVAPGFIDPHTHAYEGLPRLGLERRKNIGALMQGVTTVVLGADGRGPLDVRRVLDSATALGLGTNTYVMTGFGTVRSRVLGAATAAATQ
ncbi:MAG: D-aminoacylase, partial [Gemmatimonadaceae bacterium]|nr:D-aminoacylase [Gemmatimonadaceae bacterium]